MTPERLAEVLEALADGPPWDTAWLRSLLPELAVRGRLVAQEAADEDALLAELAAAKQAADSGKRRTRKSSSKEETAPSPAWLPEAWSWLPVGDLAEVIRGVTFAKKDVLGEGQGVPILRANNIQDRITFDDLVWISETQVDESQRLQPGDSMICIASGSASLVGKNAMFERDDWDGSFGGFNAVVRPFAPLPPKYVSLFLGSPSGWESMRAMSRGIGINNLKTTSIAVMGVPLPPLAEQHRIVAKVDELMGHAAVVESRHLAASSARVRFRDAALHALAEAEDHEAVATAWSMIEDHFDDLFTEPEDIQPLRQTILQLAVRGRLVAQEAGDEEQEVGTPASDIPGGWRLTPFAELGDHRLGKMLDKAKNRGELRPYLRNVNVRWFGFDLEDLKSMRVEEDELEDVTAVVGDVLICEGGEPGRCAVWRDAESTFVIQKALHRLRPGPGTHPDFVALSLRAEFDSGRLSSVYTGATIKHLTGKALKSYEFALPPLAEQHRIVATVDELMALCDTLETGLERAKTTREQFATSISHALTTPEPVPA